MAASSKDASESAKGINGLKIDDGTPENEVRITSTHKMRNYITYCLACFEDKGFSSVTLKAMGRAITKAVIITEVLKHHVPGLHQDTSIASVSVTDSYEPKEAGLEPVSVTRYASVIDIKLSKEPLDSASPGYQAPLPAESATPLDPHDEAELLEEDDQGRPIRHRSRRGARGGRGPRGGERGGGGDGDGDHVHHDSAAGGGGHQEGAAHHEGGGGRGRGRGGRGGAGAGGHKEDEH